jgi:hypothetical protein
MVWTHGTGPFIHALLQVLAGVCTELKTMVPDKRQEWYNYTNMILEFIQYLRNI